ncbi:MAG: response regulator [Bdellovibrionia bacterium]
MMNAPKRKVLVIDDDPAILETLELVLSQQDLEVTKADSGMAAVEAAKRGSFDIAITDFKMPGMNGLDTLAALKKIAPLLPVIVITGFATENTASEFKRLGAFGLIRKPFALDDLFAVVNKALQSPRVAT